MLRVKEHATAQLLTDLLQDVEVNQLTLVSGTSDDTNPDSPNDFGSNTQQRISTQKVPLVAPGDLTRLSTRCHTYGTTAISLVTQLASVAR
jgi:hypothetical protein